MSTSYPDTDEQFFLPKLKLSPIHPLDAKGQEHPGMTDSEIEQAETEARAKARKPVPGAKPTKPAPKNDKQITVN